MSETPVTNQKLQIGEELGPFRIVEQIGIGGSAVVYKAQDAVMNRFVAVKQLMPDHDDEVFRQRFRQEAEMQRRISEKHPAIVKLYDVRDDQRGLFLIMEYVEGRSLEQVLAKTGEPIEPLAALKVVYAIADVLEKVHEQGVIHRDLKPANILLPSQSGMTVKICDLGLAAIMAEQEALSLGSVRYMAPELFNDGTHATGQADLYSLGMIGYEMLIGRKAFDQTFRTILRDQRSQAMRWMKWHTNSRLKVTPVNQINDRVPLTVSELIGRLLEKEPIKRVDSATQLKEAIQRHFGRRTRQSAPADQAPADLMANSGTTQNVYSTPGDTATVPRKKNWLPWVAAAVVTLVLGVGGYFIMESMQHQQAQAERLAEARSMLREAENAYAQGELVKAHNRYNLVLESWSDEPAFKKRAEAGLMLVNTKRHLEEGNLDAAAKLLEEIEESDSHDLLTIRTLSREIELRQNFRQQVAALERAFDQGRLGAARVIIDEYMDAELSLEEMQQLQSFAARLQMALAQRKTDAELEEVDALLRQGDRTQAITRLETLLTRSSDPRIAEQLDQLQSQTNFEQLIASAQQAQSGGRLAQAIATYRKAAEIRPDPALEQTIKQLKVADLLARAKKSLDDGDATEARFLYLEVTDLAPNNPEAKRQLAAMEQTNQRLARIQAGDASFHREQYQAAIGHYQAAQQMGQDAAVAEKLREARTQLAMTQARGHEAAGRSGQAVAAYRQALQLNPSLTEASDAVSRLDLKLQYQQYVKEGDKLRRQAKYAQAVEAYRLAREVMQTEAIQKRLNDMEFELLIARTRSLIAARRYDAAASMLKTASAKPSADPVVVGQLLDELEQKKEEVAP